jgi:uncharacterized protein YndB with AHSA1/START domain
MNKPLDAGGPQLVLVGETDVLVRRDFSHPPARVWRALTEPALIRQWLAARDPMTRCEMDPRPGGSFLYEWAAFSFSGPILDVDAPRHMAHVEHFSLDPAYRVAVTTDLAAQGSGTRLTHVMRYPDAAARAAAIEAGFADGLGEVLGRIETLTFDD